MNKLSIIIPYYNGIEHIEDCINSIAKLRNDYEVILVDDGSNEINSQFIDERYSNNEYIQIFHKENGGIVDARNFGLTKATGDYIIFVDQDDFIDSETIKMVYNECVQDKYDFVFWSTERFYDEHNVGPCDIIDKDVVYFQSEIKLLLKQILIKSAVKKTDISYIGHVWQGMYQKEFLKRNSIIFKRFVDIEDDYLFVYDCLCHAAKIKLFCSVGYYWRYNKKSETYRIKFIDNILNKFYRLYNYLEDGAKTLLTPSELEYFKKFFYQNLMVKCIENCAQIKFYDKKELKKLKSLYKENKNYFKQDAIYTYYKREARIYRLLKNNLFGLACKYNYFDSIYRYIRRKK